jgi:hypothetical protein
VSAYAIGNALGPLATENPYRRGGMLISRRVFGEALDHEANLVEIFI